MVKLDKKQAKQIRDLNRLKDDDIDLTDIPELLDTEKMQMRRFYRSTGNTTVPPRRRRSK